MALSRFGRAMACTPHAAFTGLLVMRWTDDLQTYCHNSAATLDC
jgi:hypothetical protein